MRESDAEGEQREARARRRDARVVALPRRPPESPLRPHDFDRALRRMKADLALTALKRQLLEPGLDGKTVLCLVDQIEGLQREF